MRSPTARASPPNALCPILRLLREHDLAVCLDRGLCERRRLRGVLHLASKVLCILFCATALFRPLFSDDGQCSRFAQQPPCERSLRYGDLYQRCVWVRATQVCEFAAPPISFYSTISLSFATLLFSGGLAALCCAAAAAASPFLFLLLFLQGARSDAAPPLGSRVAPEEASEKVCRATVFTDLEDRLGMI